MASSLVADYGTSSENESDIESTNSEDEHVSEAAVTDTRLHEGVEQGADDNANSEDEEDFDDEGSGPSTPERLPNPIAGDVLPSATTLGIGRTVDKARQVPTGAVFSNEYQAAETVKNSILEQHVKMTSTELRKEKDGQKVCWNYRKGRCYKGGKCKFAHDNDIGVVQNIKKIKLKAKPCISKAASGHVANHIMEHARKEGPVDPKIGKYMRDAWDKIEDPVADDSWMREKRTMNFRSSEKDELAPAAKMLRSVRKHGSAKQAWATSRGEDG